MKLTSTDSNRLKVIRALFITGEVKKMTDIAQVSPTMMARLLKMNHSRYVGRLHKPDLFSVAQIISLASLIQVDPMMIFSVICKQAASARLKKK